MCISPLAHKVQNLLRQNEKEREGGGRIFFGFPFRNIKIRECQTGEGGVIRTENVCECFCVCQSVRPRRPLWLRATAKIGNTNF